MRFLTNLLTANAAQNAPELFFKPEKFVEMLRYMGIGMLVIFVIIAVIILCTVVTNRIFSPKKKDGEN